MYDSAKSRASFSTRSGAGASSARPRNGRTRTHKANDRRVFIERTRKVQANESAHRWRPLGGVGIAKQRGGAAIRCSAWFGNPLYPGTNHLQNTCRIEI